MYKYNVSTCKCCGKSSSQKSIKSNGKVMTSSKNISTQTSFEEECKVHNQQITQLLTEVAIALRQKTKLEHQLKQMKGQIIDMEKMHNGTKEIYINEINTLKNDNFKTKSELSSMKISNIGEQKDLLNELSNLKTQVLELNRENSKITQDYQQEREILEQKLHSNINELNNEVKINNNLKLKLIKYRTKFKNFINYIQNLLEESRENKNEQLKYQDTLKQESKTNLEVGTNMEDLILRELFFKPNSIPNEINDTFFNFKQYDSCK